MSLPPGVRSVSVVPNVIFVTVRPSPLSPEPPFASPVTMLPMIMEVSALLSSLPGASDESSVTVFVSSLGASGVGVGGEGGVSGSFLIGGAGSGGVGVIGFGAGVIGSAGIFGISGSPGSGVSVMFGLSSSTVGVVKNSESLDGEKTVPGLKIQLPPR